MIGDRELLELAAKAIGLDIEFPITRSGEPYPCRASDMLPWNPLADDGDALRLAVKLRLMVDVLGGRNFACWGVVKGQIQRSHEVSEDVVAGTDNLAATRRAIVRAAAEIGRSMR